MEKIRSQVEKIFFLDGSIFLLLYFSLVPGIFFWVPYNLAELHNC